MGVTVSLPSDYYLRKFYSNNRQMRLSNIRTGYSNTNLVEGDSAALRKAIMNLDDIDYDRISTDELYSRIKAYADTYNNTLESASESGSSGVIRKNNQLKTLTKAEKEDLKTIGITIKSDGTLKIDKEEFMDSSIKDIKKVFSKENSYLSSIKKNASQMNKTQKQYSQSTVVSTLSIGGTTTVVSEADIVDQLLTGSNIDLQL